MLGRDAQLSELRALLAEAQPQRIVVRGPAGVGKTELVREAVRGLDVSWVDLKDASSASDARDRIDQTFDSPDALVLDGIDRVADQIDDLLPKTDVHVIVTGRRRPDFPNARAITLRPLSVDDAVALFEDRARHVIGSFEIDAASGPVVAELVERLDRNPLAIELAAARVQTLPPAELLRRLDQRFKLLRGRGDSESLEESLSLDWELTSEYERRLLAQLVPFRRGFSLEAAEQVVALGEGAPWVLDVVESLVEASVLLRDVPTDQPASVRFRLGESMRHFARLRAESEMPGLLEEAVRRHQGYFLEVGRAWSDAPLDAGQRARAALEVDNLTAVLERARSGEVAARAAVSLDVVMRHLDMPERHRAVLRRGIEAAEEVGDAPHLAQLLRSRAELELLQGELDAACDEAAEAAGLAEAHGDEALALRSRVLQAEAARRQGDVPAALERLRALAAPSAELEAYRQAHLTAALVDAGQTDEAHDVALHVPALPTDADAGDAYQTVKRLAYAHYYLGNHEEMRRLNEQALQLARRVGDRGREARALQGLGDTAYGRADYETACARYDEALASHRLLGSVHLAGVLLGNRGAALHRLDRLEEAVRSYQEALAIHRRTGARVYEAVVAQALGVAEHELDHLDDADFQYARALELFVDLEQDDDVTAVGVCRVLLSLERGDDTDVRDRLEQLRDTAEDSVVAALTALARDHLGPGSDVHFPEVEPERPSARQIYLLCGWLLGVRTPSAADLERARQSLHGRLLSRLGEPESAHQHAAPAAPARLKRGVDLYVGSRGEWFAVSGGEAVNLRRRRAHRLILDWLVRAHEEEGEPLDVHEAFELGWPGEKAAPDAAAERVYWAVGGLRKLGLDDILLTSDAGYLLDPGAIIERRDEPPQNT